MTSSCLTDMTLSTASCDSELAPGVTMATSSSNDSVSDDTAGLVLVLMKPLRRRLLVKVTVTAYHRYSDRSAILTGSLYA